MNLSSFAISVLDLDGNTLVAKEDDDDITKQKFFYHPDHLGSTDLITDSNGQIVEETMYKPFGEVIDDGFSRSLHR